MIEITLLGTGSPLVDPLRAGPATLVRAGGATLLFDCGRGVLMRAAAVGGHRQPADRARAHAPPQRPHHGPQRRDHQPLGDDLRALAAPRHRAARDADRRRRAARLAGPGHLLPPGPPRRPHLGAAASTSSEHLDGVVFDEGGVRVDRGAHRPPARRPERRLPSRARGSRGRDRRRHGAVRGPRPALRRSRRARAHGDPRRPGRARSRSRGCRTSSTTTARWSRRRRPRRGTGSARSS